MQLTPTKRTAGSRRFKKKHPPRNPKPSSKRQRKMRKQVRTGTQ